MAVTTKVKTIKNYELKSAQLDQSFPLLFPGSGGKPGAGSIYLHLRVGLETEDYWLRS
jgi:hypothetical protein